VVSVTTAPSGLEARASPSAAPSPASTFVPGPVVHMDQMGEVDYAPGELKARPGTPPGFETVTYMIDGVFQHQDSNGGGFITDGDTQWMTAGG
jgi:redox-sensitive bicupin YhaK (pirin superfamily)